MHVTYDPMPERPVDRFRSSRRIWIEHYKRVTDIALALIRVLPRRVRLPIGHIHRQDSNVRLISRALGRKLIADDALSTIGVDHAEER